MARKTGVAALLVVTTVLNMAALLLCNGDLLADAMSVSPPVVAGSAALDVKPEAPLGTSTPRYLLGEMKLGRRLQQNCFCDICLPYSCVCDPCDVFTCPCNNH
nr:hypothetical protein Iba_chr07aCG11370 [Ipomoea batatas]GME07665.1 hypothetical protein Iba_scaffold6422CG0130 [Ipomoea batatas]